MGENEIRNELILRLIETKFDFKKEVVKMIAEESDSILKFGLMGFTRSDFEIGKTIQIVNDSFDFDDNPILDDGNGVFFQVLSENEVYPFNNVQLTYDSSQRIKLFFESMLGEFRKDEYYKLFNTIDYFDPFKEVIQNVKKAVPNSIYNLDGWNSFLLQVYQILYPNFEFREFKQAVEFSKKVSDRYTFRIQYQKSEFKDSLKKGILMLPTLTIDLVCNSEQFNPDSSLVIYLGEFKNRFFRPITLQSFKAIINSEVTENGMFKSYGDVLTEQIDLETIRIFGDKIKGDIYKEAAFLECCLSFEYNSIYLDYIEKAVMSMKFD